MLSGMSLAKTADFNSHAHVERDIQNVRCETLCVYFNSHAHVERDTIGSASVAEFLHFNSHAHVERDSVIKTVTENV